MFSGFYFHDEFAVAQGNVVVDHRVAKRLGDANAHFFLGMNDTGGAQFGQDKVLGVRRGLDPDRFYSEARSEEHTSEPQSLMRISYAVFCLKKKNNYHK